MKHTALPWHLFEGRCNKRLGQRYTIAGAGFVCDNAQIQDAQLIVRACNCHEELVEACKLASKYIAKMVADNIQTVVPPQTALDRVEQAIAKATK